MQISQDLDTFMSKYIYCLDVKCTNKLWLVLSNIFFAVLPGRPTFEYLENILFEIIFHSVINLETVKCHFIK